MNTNHIEEYEFQGANVRFITDNDGKGLYCDISEDGSLGNCVSEEDWDYDRGFGG